MTKDVLWTYYTIHVLIRTTVSYIPPRQSLFARPVALPFPDHMHRTMYHLLLWRRLRLLNDLGDECKYSTKGHSLMRS